MLNCHYLYLLWLVWKWLLYLFKYLRQLVCGSPWKNELSSWEMRPKKLGFPFANKMLRLLEFLCKCQFLVPWVKWVEADGWEMRLKDLSNKSLRNDTQIWSRASWFTLGVSLILWKICSQLHFPLSWGNCGHVIKKKKNQNSQFEMSGSVKDEIDGVHSCSSSWMPDYFAKEMHTPCDWRNQTHPAQTRAWICCLLR